MTDIKLIQTETSDGFKLDGCYIEPKSSNSSAVDAILLVHGTTGNFYSGSMISILGKYFSKNGFPVVSFNTRGHDVISQGRPNINTDFAGTAFEILYDCLFDLDAMINWLKDKKFNNVCLVGSSMGAVKVTYYQSVRNNSFVNSIVAISPVRLSKKYYLNSEASHYYKKYIKLANNFVDSGLGDQLITIKEDIVPGAGLFSAKAYLDKYGSERYDIVQYVDKISSDLLILAGTNETHPRLKDVALDAYEKRLESKKKVDLLLIPGGEHGLHSMGEKLPESIYTWFKETNLP
ncbi:MAG: alpha/beta hydrolase [SAR202 cluster bacterium]|nr:alpha/beta hydrolase [SAR202 cluster bacterium]|tara:strand:- start:14134 stop:15006 length:873 start_codon:yes stop_codon:yes gene_type:complete